MGRIGVRVNWRRWRIAAAAALALALLYLAALLLFFDQIGWSMVVFFSAALLMTLALLGLQIAHFLLRGRS